MLAFVLSVIFFAFGYSCFRRPNIRINAIKAGFSQIYNRPFRNFSYFLIFIGYLSFFGVRRGFLSEGTVEYSRFAGGVVFANTTGYIEYANYLVVAGVILYFASTKKLIFSLILATPWIANQIYSGWQRYMFLNLAIGLLVVSFLTHYHKDRKTKFKNAVTIAISLVALLLLILMRNDRMFLKKGHSIQELYISAIQMPIDQILGDFAGFEGTWYTVNKAEAIQPYYGASIFYRFFVLPIPRILWPEKPLKVEFNWNSFFTGESASSKWRGGLTYAEEYIWYNTAVKGSIGYGIEEWGWIGIPINFFITGLFFAYIEKRFIKSNYSPAWLASFGVTYALITLQGRNDLFEYLQVFLLLFYLPYIFIQKMTCHGGDDFISVIAMRWKEKVRSYKYP